MTKHTPGPWILDDRYPGNVYSDDATGSIVAACNGFSLVRRPEEEAIANARLIAAAPDQNEALHVARAVMKDAQDDIHSLLGINSIIWQRMENALKVMDKAIAKAEGQA